MKITENSGLRRFGLAKSAGLLVAGVLAGGIAAGAFQASAATTSAATTSAASTSSSIPAGAPAPGQANKQSTPVRSDEKAVSTADSATLKAAAVKAVPGATVYRVETDAGDSAYEVHVTKADGSLSTVKFDKQLKLIKVETGMGTGDPAPAGHRAPSGSGTAGPGR